MVLLYINMNLPQVYMSSQPWTPLPPSLSLIFCCLNMMFKCRIVFVFAFGGDFWCCFCCFGFCPSTVLWIRPLENIILSLFSFIINLFLHSTLTPPLCLPRLGTVSILENKQTNKKTSSQSLLKSRCLISNCWKNKLAHYLILLLQSWSPEKLSELPRLTRPVFGKARTGVPSVCFQRSA